MPVFDQGYRAYEGRVRGRALRWWPISIAGLRTVRKWPFIVVLIAGAFPLIIQIVMVYAAGASREMFPEFELPFGFSDALFFTLISWEIFFVVLLMLVVGSGQIAEDVRTGALQLYFSKPITQLDYVLGKLGTVVLAGSFLTLAPSVVLLIATAAFAPDWGFLTGDPLLPLKILGFSAVVSIVLGALVLGISSLGNRGRIVGIVFAGAYFLTMILGAILPEVLRDKRWEVVHLGNCLDAAGGSLFRNGVETEAPPEIAWIVLAGVVLLSLALLARRVRAAEVVA
jgi:ABC-2 type transport system permease protein